MRQVLSPVLVGRRDELDALDELLDAARGGHGSTVVVSGEAGIGKSRLAAEAAARASVIGMSVLKGRAVHGATQHPYRPFTEALLSGPP